jgi:hypothetical protein
MEKYKLRTGRSLFDFIEAHRNNATINGITRVNYRKGYRVFLHVAEDFPEIRQGQCLRY